MCKAKTLSVLGVSALLSSCSQSLLLKVSGGDAPVISFFGTSWGMESSKPICLDGVEVRELPAKRTVWQIERKLGKGGFELCAVVNAIRYGDKLNGYETAVQAERLRPGVRYMADVVARARSGTVAFTVHP